MTDFTYRVEESKNGGSTIIVTREGKDYPLHSRIDPMREGEKNSPELVPGKYDLLIVLGCGLGYHLSSLRDAGESYRDIVIIDIIPGLEKILAGIERQKFLTSLSNVNFITGVEPRAVEETLSGIIDLEKIKGVQVVEHPGSFRLFPEYYDEVKAGVRRLLDKKSGDRATVKAFGSIFLRNAVNNFSNFSRVSPVRALTGRFRGWSALIVSSAPSVEKYIEGIKKYSSRFALIAVDSALPLLRDYGIKPDFVVSIDPQQRIGEHFLGHDGTGVSHIFSIVSPPSIVEKYGGFISLNSHPVSQVIDEFYPGAVGSIDSGTGSVAGDALCFALLAGFDNIAMTGFDFSFSGNNIYARGTSYQRRYSLYFNSRVVTPESFNAAYIFRGSGSLVAEGRYTRRSFTGYRDSLVKLIGERCATPPVFINDAGLYVRGAEYLDIDSFARRCSPATEEKRSAIQGLTENLPKTGDIIDRRSIPDFMNKKGVREELLTHSLGAGASESRHGRFIRLLGRI